MGEEIRELDTRQRNVGFFCFFISGICSISSGVVVSLLQGQLGFGYHMTGTLLALFSIGNMLAGFATGILPGRIGMKRTVVLLSSGFAIGYLIMAGARWSVLLIPAFLLVGFGKGCTINTCTILVGNNVPDRTRGMNIMHSFYAMGALLCPIMIAASETVSGKLPMVLVGVCGIVLWLAFAATPMEKAEEKKSKGSDWSFLKEQKFWVLTGLLFCQNAVEISVSGWMVTYFKDSGILTGTISAYTVTVMWVATLVARLLISFVFPIRHAGAAMIKMGIGCSVFYFLMVYAKGPVTAMLLLFAFAFCMAGVNPTAVACAGKMTTVTSMGVMLPAASIGGILMPWVIGVVSEHIGINAGMACDVVPCVGMLLLSMAVKRLEQEEAKQH